MCESLKHLITQDHLKKTQRKMKIIFIFYIIIIFVQTDK